MVIVKGEMRGNWESLFNGDRVSVWEGEKVLEDFPGGPVVKIHLPVPGTQVQSLAWEDSTSCGQLSPRLLKSACARVPAQQQEKSCNEKPMCHNEIADPACRNQRQSPTAMKTQCSQKKKKKKN